MSLNTQPVTHVTFAIFDKFWNVSIEDEKVAAVGIFRNSSKIVSISTECESLHQSNSRILHSSSADIERSMNPALDCRSETFGYDWSIRFAACHGL